MLSSQLGRQTEVGDQVSNKMKSLEEEKSILEARLMKMDQELHNSDLVRESLRRDKHTVR